TVLIESVADAEKKHFPADQPGVILTQTTLSQDDTAEIVRVLLSRFPKLELPPSEDICYATQNRQNAVKDMCADIDLLLVVGSNNSSNSKRLTEVAISRGVPSYLIDGPEHIDERWLDGVRRVGVSSGASAPEEIVSQVMDYLREKGVGGVEEVDAPDEGVVFQLPTFTKLTKAGQPFS
ncbi:MAG: 4-hydroxy-3-methylbut-2-enyl diphosphate reductase, partial [Phycisphaerae bacterium]